MAKLPAGFKALNIRVREHVLDELRILAEEYGLHQEALAEALLVYALDTEHISVAVQRAKDVSDQRVRARRGGAAVATRDEASANVVQLRR